MRLTVHACAVERYLFASLSRLGLGTTSPPELAVHINCSKVAAEEILEWWHARGIGKRTGDSYQYAAGQRLDAAMELLRLGHNTQQVTPYLHWRDFEGLTGRILQSHSFEVTLNYIMVQPRMELDVVGVRLNTAIAIDCKHWGRTSHSSISRAVSKQVARAHRYAITHHIDTVPAIVTLCEDQYYVQGTPVIPVHTLNSFMDCFFGNLDVMRVIAAG